MAITEQIKRKDRDAPIENENENENERRNDGYYRMPTESLPLFHRRSRGGSISCPAMPPGDRRSAGIAFVPYRIDIDRRQNESNRNRIVPRKTAE